MFFRVFSIVLLFPNVSKKNEKLDNGVAGWRLTDQSEFFSDFF